MNIRLTWRIATFPLALAGLSVVPLMGCDKAAELQNDLCCRDFTPGADLAAVQWGLEGEAELNYGAFMQSVSDFTGAAGSIVADVTSACQAIALDLGEDASTITATKPSERATQWCELAIDAIGEASADLSFSFQPPSCTVDASVQANCEARCSANVECQLTPAEIIARCDPGQLSGRCEGTCTGSCEGSANLAVTCEGACHGTCEGTCDGECSATTAGGDCRGACDGTCTGECRGSCEIAADAQVECNADCSGECSLTFEAPKCKTNLKPPKAECTGTAECSGSCEASASARASCKEPAVTVTGGEGAEAVVATLRANLPRLLVAAQARGQLLLDSAEAVVAAAGNLEGAVTGSVKAGACIIPASNAITQAVENIDASLTASTRVMGELRIAPAGGE
ncbi:hypothetical protein BE21_12610 [Sorangium cellulosum]|uniref:Keratin associated protein n=1 Tax=Sorangium cellulosum TaxID=56 RepID=A0A150U054_SORCE|nr:hypothetical protein BE21_12610 [Sorangium cellulosum]